MQMQPQGVCFCATTTASRTQHEQCSSGRRDEKHGNLNDEVLTHVCAHSRTVVKTAHTQNMCCIHCSCSLTGFQTHCAQAGPTDPVHIVAGKLRAPYILFVLVFMAHGCCRMSGPKEMYGRASGENLMLNSSGCSGCPLSCKELN